MGCARLWNGFFWRPWRASPILRVWLFDGLRAVVGGVLFAALPRFTHPTILRIGIVGWVKCERVCARNAVLAARNPSATLRERLFRQRVLELRTLYLHQLAILQA